MCVCVSVSALPVTSSLSLSRPFRIKDFLLPPIPKPRIIGVDSLLLKVTRTHAKKSHTHTHTQKIMHSQRSLLPLCFCFSIPSFSTQSLYVIGIFSSLVTSCHLCEFFCLTITYNIFFCYFVSLFFIFSSSFIPCCFFHFPILCLSSVCLFSLSTSCLLLL